MHIFDSHETFRQERMCLEQMRTPQSLQMVEHLKHRRPSRSDWHRGQQNKQAEQKGTVTPITASSFAPFGTRNNTTECFPARKHNQDSREGPTMRAAVPNTRHENALVCYCSNDWKGVRKKGMGDKQNKIYQMNNTRLENNTTPPVRKHPIPPWKRRETVYRVTITGEMFR